jgi:hypothetical protein
MKKFFDRAEWFLENIVFTIVVCILFAFGLESNDVSDESCFEQFKTGVKQLWTREVEEK